ncbi:biotin transport system substrate-specific component [Paracoccus isoporae]|uniref:Biotin transporter n=1 Tax=Paracoccus isoporae TaxID=591205 RepID=A0A1G7BLM7_9RHOB|nr:biotin transporter BioY [Paracoccus isoporae]SDE27817.1 biotin transport system substrate-specific component [Paracoccus isoporae]
MTLSQAALPERSLLTNSLLVLAGTVLLALSAQISVPMFPVPMTLQTLAISLIGLTYGARLAAVTLIAYLAEGAMGLPVFANASGGPAPLFGPTSGFLWGFVAMAWLTGFMVERGFDRGFVKLFIAAIVPGMLLFVPGVVALKLVTGLDWQGAAMAGMVPFLVGAVVKAAIAAMAVKAGWSMLDRR